ncbi:DNA damage-induced apoptosis suppressor protein [Elephas maximus indicus]|uniref:DNA damage-induced apoptosis suppressor protein n=1 Tax=Elephas maximus indicus TaxID=99487 RepID=UPI00211635B8|nr:DNA damage-induced apoptosis suppressor protein [Elephas maximus indicus]XP_049746392.1 DNA damage-induced apoptosis suppressor protein [Elephas maximus indicus]XP_049746393.1 DNA damage-induced apoptosis suppressor protein [Elephas maximus indicus]
MNRRRKFLLASVLALQNSSFIYPSCQKCFSRIILGSKRSHCPKCGSVGKVENASYRYKLSLKVAESNKWFGITVFGSCLDTFFGLTATGLHRYIEDPNEIPETLDSDTTQNLLTKAAETCFVGQSFIFGVTQRPDCKREVKALVASQIVLPDPRVAGFTVIDYFRQLLQPSNLGKLRHGSQANSCVLALGHSDSDLSSICGSDSSSYSFKSHGRENFSRFWQSSLELISIVSEPTGDDDLSPSEQSKANGALHQNRKYISFTEVTSSSSYHDPIQSSCGFVLHVDKKSKAEKSGEELGLQANQLSVVCSSHHEVGVTDCNLLSLKIQEPREPSNTKSFHNMVEIKNTYSQPELTWRHHHSANAPSSLQERATCCSPSSLGLGEVAGGSQDCDPEKWDDLPFSESLNKFLAAIESEIAITETDASSRKYYLDHDIDKLRADHSQLSVTPQRTTGALHTPPLALRSSQTTVKSNSSKDNCPFKYEANPSPSTQKESQPDNIAETISLSANGRDIPDYVLSNAYLSALFSSSKDFGTTVTLKKTTRIQPHTAKISPRPNTSESNHSFLNIKYTNGEKSLSEVSEKLTNLCSRKCNVSDLYSLEKKQYYRWPKNQDDSFTICRQLTYPLEPFCSSPNISTNTLKEMPYGHSNNNIIQRYSTGHEGSYNASADLFDVSAKEMDVATEITKKSQDIPLYSEKSLVESHPSESDFSLRSLSENSSQSSQKLALQSIPASMYPRPCSSPPHFQSDSEYDFEDSQDFVPYSQSTPVATFHQTRIHGMIGAFEKVPAFYSDLDANCKNTRISSEIDTQQATPNGPHNKKTHIQRAKSSVPSGVTQPVVSNHCPIAECLETDIDECIPPTTKKEFFLDNLQFQTMNVRKRLAACYSPDQKELLRKKPRHVKQRMDKCLIKKEFKNKLTAIVRKQRTPKYNCDHSGWVSRKSVIELGSRSKVKCCLPFSENWPPSVPETNCAWSPELFS